MGEDKGGGVDLAPGDVVVHPQHGTATVIDVEERTVAGRSRRYVVLRHADDDLVLRVPLDALEQLGVRATAGREQAERILETLAAAPVALSSSWQRRRALNERRIRSGDPCAVAAVARDLAAWIRERDAPSTDRRMFEEARGRTVNELVEALGQGADDVAALVDAHLDVAGEATDG